MLVLPLQVWSASACVDKARALHTSDATHATHVESAADALASADHVDDMVESGCDSCFSCHGGVTKAVVATSHAVLKPAQSGPPVSAASRFASADPWSPEHIPVSRPASLTGRV